MTKLPVSILTVSQLKRHECLKLLFDNIRYQSYKNIIEVVVVEGSQNIDDANINMKLIEENIINKNKKADYTIKYIPFTSSMYIGALRNKANSNASGDILVWMDDDDYYMSTYVKHCVDTLTKSKKMLAGGSRILMHDMVLNRNMQLDFTFASPNHTTNNVLAYKKEYLINHKYDESVKNGEESSFTNKFTEPLEQMLPDKTIVHLAHSNNTYNKRPHIINGSLRPVNGWNRTNINVKDMIPSKYYDIYKRELVNGGDTEYDIIYFAGGESIVWDPSDMKLGGSEQAIVNLCTNWTKMGKKVAVFGNFKEEKHYDGTDYLFWYNFPFEKKLKTVIAWRVFGLILTMYFDIMVDNLIVDFHDNFPYTLNNINKNDLVQYFNNKVSKIHFKSNYHKTSFEEFMGYKLNDNKYKIIMNGIRTEPFSKNNNYIRNPYRFCYCSCYTRGLDVILAKLWPIIIKKEPRAELHVYYGMDGVKDVNYKNNMKMLLSQPGVMDHDRQPMDMIIREKYSSTFHLYITNSISEIDCISIRESLVTGCIPIISNFGVFIERDGIKLDWDPSNDKKIAKCAEEICNKMQDNEYVEKMRSKMLESKTIVDWYDVATKWLAL